MVLKVIAVGVAISENPGKVMFENFRDPATNSFNFNTGYKQFFTFPIFYNILYAN